MSSPHPTGLSHATLLAHVDWIRRLAAALVADRELAEDLVQETCVVALERAPAEQRNLRQWLAVVLHNLLRQRVRAEKRRELREALRARPEVDESEAELLERVKLQRELVDAVLTLDEPYRTAILLRFFQELPPREIARRQGVPVDTVNSRLQRGLGVLRRRLERDTPRWALVLGPLLREPGTWLATPL
ncbi:MAG: RNA polymerase sigma factor, partial [Planctomycetota bacterium]